MSKNITNNQRPTLNVVDANNSTPFAVKGNSSDGSMYVTAVNAGQLVPEAFDAITYTATSGTVDTFKYYTGGTGGTLVATVTVTYTDSTHATLVSVVRT